ncbi:MAG TPA: DUF167 family protein [Parvibaculum sp.]|uniref:DUF167 family protein n=1 Tax=Parvibaculum sp. TaxID=2024848 RepID=UPI002C412FF4|nr:DUF167 family protein [Parvibaculum sp.]HMM15612.1 DUF167 family protein [Parvibaculum sp.]
MVPSLPLRTLRDAIAVAIRVTPKGGASRIEGLGADADGRSFLRVRVKEVPEKGKANAAVVKLLAKAWGLPPSAIEIAAGETGRVKTVVVHGADAGARIAAWFETLA